MLLQEFPGEWSTDVINVLIFAQCIATSRSSASRTTTTTSEEGLLGDKRGHHGGGGGDARTPSAHLLLPENNLTAPRASLATINPSADVGEIGLASKSSNYRSLRFRNCNLCHLSSSSSNSSAKSSIVIALLSVCLSGHLN